jgi:hypothetical protein
MWDQEPKRDTVEEADERAEYTKIQFSSINIEERRKG